MMKFLYLYYILSFYTVIPTIVKGSSNNNSRNIVEVGGYACLDSGTLTIMCDVVIGVSNVNRQWYRDGILQSETGCNLTVSASNKGTNYTCIVSNQCGEDRATTIVRSK